MEQADAEVRADDVSVLADEGGSVIDEELVGKAAAADRFFEGVVEALSVLGSVVGSVRDLRWSPN